MNPRSRIARADRLTPWLLGAWGLGFAVAAGLALRRWRQTRGVIARSVIAPDAIQTMARGLAGRIGLRRVPRVHRSEDIETPMVAGLVRPVVLVPAGRFSSLSTDQQQMALCHELVHVKRADLWLGCVPALAERLFFFHPLAHLASREYMLWREAACDQAVIDALAAPPQAYGRLLLDLGVSRRGMRFAAAGAPWSFSSLKRRIVMLRDPSPRRFTTRALALAAMTIGVATLVPFQLVARSAPPTSIIHSGPAPDAPPAAAVAQTPDARDAGVESSSRPDMAAAPSPDVRGQDERKGPRLAFVMFHDGDHTNSSGSSDDVERARRYRKPGERLLWFRHDGREYLVRDRAILEQADQVWHEVGELGRAMGELGGKQGALGARQGEFGAKQGEIGAQQGVLGARQGELGMRQAALATRQIGASDADRATYERERRDIDAQMRALGDEMSALGEKMREFEQPMRALGDEMSGLGRELEALGRKMEEASHKAEREMRLLIERAIASGAATPAR